jgi:hypothetical protein
LTQPTSSWAVQLSSIPGRDEAKLTLFILEQQ